MLAAAPLLFGVAFHGKFPGGQAVLPWALVYCTWFGLAMVMQNYLLCPRKRGWCAWRWRPGWHERAVEHPAAAAARAGGGRAGDRRRQRLSLLLICWFNRRLGFRLDDGLKLVLVLPMLLCLGPWVSFLGSRPSPPPPSAAIGCFRRKKNSNWPREWVNMGSDSGWVTGFPPPADVPPAAKPSSMNIPLTTSH